MGMGRRMGGGRDGSLGGGGGWDGTNWNGEEIRVIL